MDLEKGEKTPLFAISQIADMTDENSPNLPPLMVSVGEEDFLVTTGTTLEDPAIGMFIDLNGDTVRGSLMFSTYPRSLGRSSFFVADFSNNLSSTICPHAEFRCRNSFRGNIRGVTNCQLTIHKYQCKPFSSSHGRFVLLRIFGRKVPYDSI